MPDLSAVGAIARAHDPDRFLCALWTPPERREAAFALIAFNHELARAREVTDKPLVALMRLTWWREVLEADAPRRHEVAEPLHEAIAEGALRRDDLLAMVEAREAEAEEEGFASTGAFHAYLSGTAGGFAVALGRALGAPPELLPGLQRAGMLYGLAGVLRALSAHSAQGRCLLPADRVDAGSVIADPGRARDAVRALAAEAPPEPDLAALPRGAVAAALPLVLARRDLRRLARGILVRRGTLDRLAVTLAGMRGRV
ncbi:squalene/phytoene synthase family protein [Sabulicella rubraurantiaca]|uniref:squalene/phytoene synthase family protein n=1 Tax=Sabulicella rubraurantiaca TaxID=2811429 RepID=UPI001A97AAAD|nr:squalene/phytoene synthase family protein [Sabulicella rubraurantiaca]